MWGMTLCIAITLYAFQHNKSTIIRSVYLVAHGTKILPAENFGNTLHNNI